MYHIQAFQLAKTCTLGHIQDYFELKFTKSLDGSFFCEYGEDQYLYFYKFSVLVFLGFRSEEVDFHVEKITNEFIKSDKKDLLSQEYIIDVDAGLEKKFKISDEKVVLKEMTSESLEIIAFSLAHTVAMEHYEQATEYFFEKLNFYEEIKKFGQVKLSEKIILKNIAELLGVKHEIVNELYLLDKPEIIWDDISLEHLYNALYNFFDINDRFKAIEYKLNFMSENISFLHEVIDSKKAHFLERIIIWLIVVEIVFTLIDFVEKYIVG